MTSIKLMTKKYDEDWCIGTVQSDYLFFLYDVTAANNA